MTRSYNIGTECFALITSPNEPECLLPTKVVILDKYIMGEKVLYKVRIKEVYEDDMNFLKEHIPDIKVQTNIKSASVVSLVKRNKLENINTKGELLQELNDKQFYIEDNYVTLDKEGLEDLYNKFVKYIINYHYRKLYQLTSRSFLRNQYIYNDQKDVFKRRVERLGFGDMFQKYELKLDI